MRNAVPELAAQRRTRSTTRWTSASTTCPTQNRILFHYSTGDGTGPCCYDTVVSESRIADYIGIAKGELPRKEYYGRWRTFPDTCDYSWQETRPTASPARYDGVSVYDGSYPYGATRLTPSWGGSMFEALMPSLFVPEERVGRRLVAENHPLTVDAQIDHGLNVAGTAPGASRRPTPPRAATAPTASTPRGWTRTA